jgi:hypothetical protein
MSTTNYTFLPWVRYGLGNFITREDNIADTTIERSKLNVSLNLKDDSESLDQEVHLTGPGDVIGIQPHAIIRNEPTTGTNEFDPNSLAFVEFCDEDFPWRYTSAMPATNAPERLRPWLMLIVLKENEFTWLGDSQPLPSIQISKPVLDQLPEESWAWAHVQVHTELSDTDSEGNQIPVETALEKLLREDADMALSRVMCSRKLEPEQQYFAFLVPAFETGRLAGLGQDFSSTPIQQASWSVGMTDFSFPFYHHYGFSTGENIGFETLARKLAPNPIDNSEVPGININDLYEELGVDATNEFPNYTLEDNMESLQVTAIDGVRDSPVNTNVEGSSEWKIESALVSPSHQHQWYGDENKTNKLVRNALEAQINEGENLQTTDASSATEDPVINVPPLYGRWHASQSHLDSVANKLENEAWLTQLNLDPAFRIAAGIGADIVREKQEDFMQQAWDQVGEIREANQQLKQAELNKEVTQAMYQKHMEKRAEEQVLGMTPGLHGKIQFDSSVDTTTIHQKVSESALPNASLDPAFTKLLRKRGPFTKKLNQQLSINGEELQNNFISKMADNTTASVNEDVTAAKAKATDKSLLMDFAMVGALSAKIQTYLDSFSANRAVEFENIVQQQENDATSAAAALSDFSTTQLTQSESQLKEQLKPLNAIPKQILSNLDIQGGPSKMRVPNESAPKPIMAHPEFEQATFSYLEEKYPDFLSPTMGQMKNDTISLMKVNQPFIESFLVGMNHTMGNELLWREFPTDQRGSYFKQFWNTSEYLNAAMIPDNPEDISPIAGWNSNSALGSHSPTGIDQDGKVVLLLKGELFKQYPNMPLFAQKAEWHNGEYRKLADPNVQGNVIFPLFRIPLKDNLLGLAFHLTVDEVQGDLLPNGDPDPAGDAGWFFIFKERMGELKFGLDEDTGTAGAIEGTAEDDLHWGQVIDSSAPTVQNHIPIGSTANLVEFVWGSNSAQMACILEQKPVTLGFHASSLIK